MHASTRRMPRPRVRVALTALLAVALVGAAGTARPHEPAARARPAATLAADTTATTFRLSSFNLLGAGHTAPGGDRKGYESGKKRMKYAVRLLDDNAIDVVGFQEMQPEQYAKFMKLRGDQFGIFPGNQLPNAAMANSIAWRQDTWQLVRTATVAVPYFKGHLIRMPYVLLQNRQTGQQAYFFNTHNPADAHGPAQKWRDKATKIEIKLFKRLRAETPGIAVFATGDMNDRAEFFCPVVRKTDLHAANGGTSVKGSCVLPPVPRVDWIFGSSEVGFSGYAALRNDLVKKATDHFMITTSASIAPPIAEDTPVDRVVVLEVAGLRSKAVRRLGRSGAPALYRLLDQGAGTLNARTAYERTTTLPNLVSMATGRRVSAKHGGHGVKADRDRGGTVAQAAGGYVSSMFDVVHDAGGRTALYSSAERVALLERSWNKRHGAADRYGVDDGRDKIDRSLRSTGQRDLVGRLTQELRRHPRELTFAQISALDDAGRAHRWMSKAYLAKVRAVDAQVGKVLDTIESRAKLRESTLVLLTASSGGKGHDHDSPGQRANFTVPFLAWGHGVPAGADLYDLNPGYTDPGKRRVRYRGAQPVRNGYVANVATGALGLPAVPGSELDADQDLAVFATP